MSARAINALLERRVKELEAELDRAKRVLLRAGFEDLGGQEWKPPLGQPPKFVTVHPAGWYEFLEDLSKSGKDLNGAYWIPRAAALLANRAPAIKAGDQAQAVDDARDAARYRWLRNPDPQPHRALDVLDDDHNIIEGKALDAAIDAAMSASRPDDKGAA